MIYLSLRLSYNDHELIPNAAKPKIFRYHEDQFNLRLTFRNTIQTQ